MSMVASAFNVRLTLTSCHVTLQIKRGEIIHGLIECPRDPAIDFCQENTLASLSLIFPYQVLRRRVY